MRDDQTILTQEHPEGVFTITINRPERRNALTVEMSDTLLDIYTRLAEYAPRVVIITGVGQAFCSGADLLSETFQRGDRAQAAQHLGEAMRRSFNPMMQAFHALPCPTIARVNGVAAGAGASVALLADIVIAARSSSFLFPFAPRLGLVPDLSATWTLPRLVGRAAIAPVPARGSRERRTTQAAAAMPRAAAYWDRWPYH